MLWRGYSGSQVSRFIIELLVVIGLMIWAYVFGAYSGPRTDGLTVVESICGYSRTVQSGEWEDACGVAQDSINAEYICDKEVHRCWAELKKEQSL